jgi:hypothetical protein
MTFDVAIEERDTRLRIAQMGYSFQDHRIDMRLTADGKYDFRYDEARQQSVSPPIGLGTFPRGIENHGASSLLGWLPSELSTALHGLLYLGPLRTDPRRNYLWVGQRPGDLGRDGRNAILVLLANRDNSVKEQVAQWLRRLNLIESFRIEPIAPSRRDYEVLIKTTPNSPEVLLTGVGFGLSQVLPVLVLCAMSYPDCTIILEQPEIHLHPSAQSDLADVLIDAVTNRNLQIIVESHSEHLLRRIQRRVAEGSFAAEDAALYFCEMENGESKARELELTDDGFIKNWPKDFFGDEMGDLGAMTEAAAKRHMIPAK